MREAIEASHASLFTLCVVYRHRETRGKLILIVEPAAKPPNNFGEVILIFVVVCLLPDGVAEYQMIPAANRREFCTGIIRRIDNVHLRIFDSLGTPARCRSLDGHKAAKVGREEFYQWLVWSF